MTRYEKRYELEHRGIVFAVSAVNFAYLALLPCGVLQSVRAAALIILQVLVQLGQPRLGDYTPQLVFSPHG